MNILATAIILVLIALLIVFLLGPFRLYFSLSKDDIYLQSFYELSFLGFTLTKGVIPSIQSTAAKEIVGDQEHQEAIASKKIDASDKVSDDRAYEDADIGADRKPKKIPSQTETRLIIDAFPQITQILVDLIKSMNIRRFFCEISFGLDDPVDTAVMNGYLWSIVAATGLYRTDISIKPRFDGAQLDGSILAIVEAKMLWFAVAAVRALEEEKTRKLIFELIRGGVS